LSLFFSGVTFVKAGNRKGYYFDLSSTLFMDHAALFPEARFNRIILQAKSFE
jgi:hypothetical protein